MKKRYSIFIALWFALLFLPFKGLKASLVLFAVLAVSFFLLRIVSGHIKMFIDKLHALSRKISSAESYVRTLAISRYALLLLLFILPLITTDYFIDVAILVGIYIILAQGLNVVVGFAGLLNLGFVAFYAIGAYSYALLNTSLGLGFWTAMPLSVTFTALSGFVLAVPALRLRGDYLAIVTLGFGEIVRLVLNNSLGLFDKRTKRYWRHSRALSARDASSKIKLLLLFYFDLCCTDSFHS
ncbi:MAG: hypothetical protein HY755_10440 [Nitrospirae bacterium]|nr:hypothetical protein [Nitrospirota bacterium]